MNVLLTTSLGALAIAGALTQAAHFAPPAHADTASAGARIAQQGKDGAVPACMSCHGDRGQGLPEAGYPFLAGQSSQYLLRQLQAFASGERQGTVMQPFATALDDTEMRAVADYYAQLPPPDSPARAVTAAPDAEHTEGDTEMSLGMRLAVRGKWVEGIPACFQCHGPQGRGVAPNFPIISGQPADYIKTQLLDWKAGHRVNDTLNLMQTVAGSLTDDEITAVADYLAGLPPSAKE